MNNDQREKAKKYGIYAVLAAALLISAAVSAVIDKNDNKRVVIYSTSSAENSAEQNDSSKAKSEKTKKVTTQKTSKVTEAKTTKQTTSKTSKTTKVKTSKTAKTSKEASEVNFPIDINLVTYDELLAINGIGEGTARAILDLRDRVGVITYMEMLLEISGIGENKLTMLSEYLYVDDADYSPPPDTATEIHTTVPTNTYQPIPNDTKPYEEIPTDTTFTETVPPVYERKPVNINEADVYQLMECLLIDEELAQSILEIREQLGGKYENALQLLYVKGISKDMLSELKEYVLLE
ncbi:MAG: helix-hairpin-helix domain-containing protein [Ruminococcus sp.]|uniref:ComEA family DNA-binding protein n=1 Tax=Ruminococcus sp. TaxID=41978 RepID=UPI0025FD967D|nr:helix-hairpin-helix domain-containing protein [Ruminococcus sp.]MCR5541961.1 helix-hairpin-helix domain-containing protein [Ruminococcus sp.]